MPTSTVRLFAVATASLSLMLSERSSAQSTSAASPDTVLPPTAGSIAPDYLRAVAALPSPEFESNGQYLVQLVAAPSAARLDTLRSLPANLQECAATPASQTLPRGQDSESIALDGTSYFVVIVVAAKPPRSACATAWSLSDVAIWRGMSLADPSRPAAAEARAAELEVDGRPVSPAFAVRRPAFELADGVWKQAGTQLRYYYDMSLLEPRNGPSHRLVMRVWGREGPPAVIDVQSAASRRLSFEYIAWMLARAPRAGVAPALSLRPAQLISPPVRRLVDSAKVDLIAAGTHAASWTSSQTGRESLRDDHAISSIIVAEALLANGEQAIAAAVVADVRRSHPCLVPPIGSSESLIRIAREPVITPRCVPLDVAKVRRARLVPGRLNMMAGRRGAGLAAAGAVGTALVVAVVFDHRARGKMKDARASDNSLQYSFLRSRAAFDRETSKIAAAVGAGVWIYDAVTAGRAAYRHDRDVAADRL